MSIYQLPKLNATKWIKLDSHYPMPCYNAIERPNHVHFTLATNSAGKIFITVVFADIASKMYKVAYLDPELNQFTPFKNLTTFGNNCFGNNSVITAMLNFKKDNSKNGGQIRISQPTGCDAEFSEEDFFSNKTILGVLNTARGRPQVSMDDNEADNLIYETIQQNPNKSNLSMDDNEADNLIYETIQQNPNKSNRKYFASILWDTIALEFFAATTVALPKRYRLLPREPTYPLFRIGVAEVPATAPLDCNRRRCQWRGA
uniref:Uncharacterized protein n=1 Tax=Panagrolaimus sp. PS1159 TaxID=55785 RepID=A0AC35FII4_9BILA